LNCAPRQIPINVETIAMETLDHKDLFADATVIFQQKISFSINRIFAYHVLQH